MDTNDDVPSTEETEPVVQQQQLDAAELPTIPPPVARRLHRDGARGIARRARGRSVRTRGGVTNQRPARGCGIRIRGGRRQQEGNRQIVAGPVIPQVVHGNVQAQNDNVWQWI